eukprot:1149801-Pelagomonas_calceolata.AAC.6
MTQGHAEKTSLSRRLVHQTQPPPPAVAYLLCDHARGAHQGLITWSERNADHDTFCAMTHGTNWSLGLGWRFTVSRHTRVQGWERGTQALQSQQATHSTTLKVHLECPTQVKQDR